MLRLLGVVVSIGLADSLNPSTLAPALYLATGEHAVRDLIQFTLGVVGVYLLGGLLLVIGPGEAILALVPHPHATARYVLETIAGVVMLVAGFLLWTHRYRLAKPRDDDDEQRKEAGRPALLLGVTITVVELPTAFPYFAAIAAIVGSGEGLVHQLVLVVIYNACFVLPLVLIIVVVEVAGDQAERILSGVRDYLQQHWPVILAVVALVAGTFTTVIGVLGLAGLGHGPVAGFSRGVRKVIAR
jgi:cytochrome c biogenesis protein CcdA